MTICPPTPQWSIDSPVSLANSLHPGCCVFVAKGTHTGARRTNRSSGRPDQAALHTQAGFVPKSQLPRLPARRRAR